MIGNENKAIDHTQQFVLDIIFFLPICLQGSYGYGLGVLTNTSV